MGSGSRVTGDDEDIDDDKKDEDEDEEPDAESVSVNGRCSLASGKSATGIGGAAGCREATISPPCARDAVVALVALVVMVVMDSGGTDGG